MCLDFHAYTKGYIHYLYYELSCHDGYIKPASLESYTISHSFKYSRIASEYGNLLWRILKKKHLQHALSIRGSDSIRKVMYLRYGVFANDTQLMGL